MTFLEQIGETVQDIVSGVGDNYEASGVNALATARANNAIASLIEAKAAATKEQSKATANAIKTLVVGIVVVMVLYVSAKFVLPKLIK